MPFASMLECKGDVAIGSELAFRHVRTRADVEAATAFASDLFLGGIERMSRKL